MSNSRYTYTWHIGNFDLCTILKKQFVSPSFIVDNFKDSKWCLIIDFTEDDEYLSCYLKRLKGGARAYLDIDFKISDLDKEVVKSHKVEKCSFGENDTYGFSHFMKLAELGNNEENWTDITLVIQCRITKIYEKISKTKLHAENVSYTTFDLNVSNFLWNVNYNIRKDWIETKIFLLPDTTKIKMCLTSPEDDILIEIHKAEELFSISQFLACEIVLLDRTKVSRACRRAKYNFNSKNNSIWAFPTFFTRTQLQAKEQEFLNHDSFALILKFIISNDIFVTEYDGRCQYEFPRSANIICPTDVTSAFHEDIQSMLTDQTFCDVELRVSNGLIKAHKLILASRSPVFAAMFKHPMQESQSGIVDIPDMDYNTAIYFLKFLYTGKLSNIDFKTAINLIIIANKYQIRSFTEKCSFILIRYLSCSNIYEVLSTADLIENKILKEHACDFILDHREDILLSEDWAKFIDKNPKLATDILRKLSVTIAKE